MTTKNDTEDGGAVERPDLPSMKDAAAAVAEILLPLSNAQRFRVLASMVVLYGIRATRRVAGLDGGAP